MKVCFIYQNVHLHLHLTSIYQNILSISIFIALYSKNMLFSLYAMEAALNEFYNNFYIINYFIYRNLEPIFLHITHIIFMKFKVLKPLSKAPKFITPRIREREREAFMVFYKAFTVEFPSHNKS